MTPLWTIEFAGLTDPGLARKVNEDAWIGCPETGIFAVADGMGGHQRGDLASRMVIEALAELPPAPDARTMRERLELALAGVDQTLRTTDPEDISGTTVVVLLICELHFAVLWAGDSRAYRLGANGFEPMTRDHSLVQVLVDSGELAPEAARGHHLANQVTRAVGAVPDLLLEGTQGELRSGDSFLLCSDGLTRHVEDSEIAAALAGMVPQQAADHLLRLTLERGARDNVTVVVVRVSGAEVSA